MLTDNEVDHEGAVPPRDDEQRTIEELGRELLGVRGYDASGKALHDLATGEGRAWLYNAARAAHRLAHGRRMTRGEFIALVERTTQIKIG